MLDCLRSETTGLKSRSDGLIVGYANTPVVDRGDMEFRDFIPAEIWLRALVAFFANGAEINVMHRNIPGGETVSVDVTPNGPLLVTRPTKDWVASAIEAGDLKGYSIEYYAPAYRIIQPGSDEYRALLHDPLETRAIRYYEEIAVVRVSYVDEPMNQGSYFLGGKALDLSQFQFRFDRDKGEVVIYARTDEAMATLAGMLADEFKAARPDAPVRGISFKFASDEPQQGADGRRGGLFGRLASALGKESTDEEDTLNAEVKALIDGMKADIEALKGKLDAIQPQEGAKADDVAALKAAVDALVAALPKPDATIEERVKAIGESTELATLGSEVSGLKAGLAELKGTVESLIAALEKNGKSAVVAPVQTPKVDGAKGSAWGPGGTGSSLYK